MSDLFEEVAKEYGDEKLEQIRIKDRILYMKHNYSEGRSMKKCELEFLNYYLNDLKPRIAERNRQH